eukprot:3124762-Pyramimonas_sp.AAC.1
MQSVMKQVCVAFQAHPHFDCTRPRRGRTTVYSPARTAEESFVVRALHDYRPSWCPEAEDGCVHTQGCGSTLVPVVTGAQPVA